MKPNNNLIKILIFTPSLYGGGAERTIVNLVQILIKHHYSVTIVIAKSIENNHEYPLPDGINLIRLHCKKTKFSFFKLIHHINKENPNIIFSTLNFSNILAYFANAFSFKRKVIVLREATHRYLSGETSFTNKLLTRYIYNNVNKVIALSEGVKDELVHDFKININKICVIYNPVDIVLINRLKNEYVSDFDFLLNPNVIIYVGRLHPQKDIFTLLKACKILKNKISFKLILLGAGPQEELLKKFCYENDLDDFVCFLGFKENPYKYIGRSSILVLPSNSEGFGHVIVEAMTLGIPVISSNCPSGPREIIKNNEFGELFEIGNYIELASKILYILGNSKRKNQLKRLGKKRAADFALNKIGQDYIRIFQELL